LLQGKAAEHYPFARHYSSTRQTLNAMQMLLSVGWYLM
jgi:hypothetical protein